MDEIDSLIERVLAGDLAAFERLVLHYQIPIRAFFAARLSDPYTAEDLAQDTFLVAFRKLKQYQRGQPFLAWLRGIAVLNLRNHQRKAHAEPCGATAQIDALMSNALEKSTWVEFATDALRLCLGRLDDDAQKLLHRRYADEQSIAQLEEELSLKHSHLTMRLHRLRVQLRACIEQRVGSSRGASSGGGA